MPVGKNSRLIQIVVSDTIQEFVEKLSRDFKISVGEYCRNAIVTRILNDFQIQKEEMLDEVQKTSKRKKSSKVHNI